MDLRNNKQCIPIYLNHQVVSILYAGHRSARADTPIDLYDPQPLSTNLPWQGSLQTPERINKNEATLLIADTTASGKTGKCGKKGKTGTGKNGGGKNGGGKNGGDPTGKTGKGRMRMKSEMIMIRSPMSMKSMRMKRSMLRTSKY